MNITFNGQVIGLWLVLLIINVSLFSRIFFKKGNDKGFKNGQYAEPPQDMPYEDALNQAILALKQAASQAPHGSEEQRNLKTLLVMVEGVKYLPEYKESFRDELRKGYSEIGRFYGWERYSGPASLPNSFMHGGNPAQRPAHTAPHQSFANGGDSTGRPAHTAPHQSFANGGDPTGRLTHAAPYQPFANGGDPTGRPALATPHQPFANGGDPTGRPAHTAPYQPFA
ncbi:hypothetical protein, partial [Shimazuella kribbensis]|uniref:hypothetical protein n=1 Tax=Shimazuella kribbensis TaxID=139808 RepID=UPI00056CF729